MPKTAAVLFVHNNVETIGWWIAHHISLGFSTLIICDDTSTDGTSQVLSTAATLYDIRLVPPDTTLPTRPERQAAFHTKALSEGRNTFDRMLILAADEYLHLEKASSLTDFFTQNPEDTLPINWCLFSPAQQNALTPTETHTLRAAEDTPDHRITRTLLNPAKTRTLPDPFAQTHSPPDWSKARILHYAKDLPETIPCETPDNSAHKWLNRTRKIAAQITQTGLTDLFWQLKNAISQNDLSTLDSLGLTPQTLQTTHIPNLPEHQFFILGQKQHLVLDLTTQTLTTLPPDQQDPTRYSRLILVVPPHQTSPAFLITEDACSFPYLPLENATSLLAAVPLKLNRKKREFLNSSTQHPVTVNPTENALTRTPSTPALEARIFPLMLLQQNGNTLLSLLQGIELLPAPDATALGCAIAALKPQDAKRLTTQFPGLIPPNLQAASAA